MKHPGSNTERRGGCPGLGFTLIELLVVVSIIALLISILLPSLKSAREQAKTVACMATQAAIARGGATYQSEWNDWLPGSPGTSGSVLLGREVWEGNELFMPCERVQTWDWATPLGMYKHLSNNRSKRWGMLVRQLLCPSNAFLSQPFYEGQKGARDGWPNQPMVSYNTLRQYMYWPRLERTDGTDVPWGPRAPFPAAQHKIPNTTHLPQNYQPRIGRVGAPSEHVFLSDSSRFTPPDGKPDHHIVWTEDYGGGWSDGGPTLKAVGSGDDREDQNYLRAFKINPKLAPLTYRHKRGKRLGIVVAFYDGSAKWMSEKQTRFPDPWWPKGTEIPIADMNVPTLFSVFRYLTDDNTYIVPK